MFHQIFAHNKSHSLTVYNFVSCTEMFNTFVCAHFESHINNLVRKFKEKKYTKNVSVVSLIETKALSVYLGFSQAKTFLRHPLELIKKDIRIDQEKPYWS